MLTYHPAFDINHAIFRTICILHYIDDSVDVEKKKMEVLDFFMIFPHLLGSIKLPSDIRKKYSKELKTIPHPIEKTMSKVKIFHQIRPFHNLALGNLASKNVILFEEYRNGIVKLNKDEIPEDVFLFMRDCRFSKKPWFELIYDDLARMKLQGEKGLKSRTGLLEYRYDSEN